MMGRQYGLTVLLFVFIAAASAGANFSVCNAAAASAGTKFFGLQCHRISNQKLK